MLVLTRKVGEEIVIGSDIRLTVTAIGDGRVKIGITAPPHVRIDRSEVAARIAEFTAPPAAVANRLPAPTAPIATATRLRRRSRV